jgi:hypothetical protein
MNLGYNAAYYLKQKSRISATTPMVASILPIIEQVAKLYGENTDDKTWYSQSPLPHLSTISGPVSVYWSTADMLVPINQIGDSWVRSFTAKGFPQDFTMDRLKLGVTQEFRTRLTDVLGKDSYEVWVQPAAGKPIELPVSLTKSWSILILDEGAPEPQVGHFKAAPRVTREKFLAQAMSGKVSALQLTPLKLERLMDRYAGKEWLPSGGVRHLDFPEAEKADVLRGLQTYVRAGVEHARTLAVLYEKLPPARKVLEPEVFRDLMKP